jgi:hypothetical protein
VRDLRQKALIGKFPPAARHPATLGRDLPRFAEKKDPVRQSQLD